MEFNYFDIIIATMVSGFAIRGFLKGLILSLTSFLGLIAGLYVAWHFSNYLESELTSLLSLSANVLKVLSFLLSFLIIIFVIHLLGLLLEKLVNISGLGFLNKLGGFLLGLAKGGLFISVLFYIFVRLGGPAWINPNTLSQSLLYEPILKISGIVVSEMGDYIFDQNFEQDSLREIHKPPANIF